MMLHGEYRDSKTLDIAGSIAALVNAIDSILSQEDSDVMSARL
jgi:hypothetical protein